MEQDYDSYKLYYTALDKEHFTKLKISCLLVWSQYEDFNYKAEKFSKVVRMENVKDNYMSMIAMFDHINQAHLFHILPLDLLARIRDALPEDHLTWQIIMKELQDVGV